MTQSPTVTALRRRGFSRRVPIFALAAALAVAAPLIAWQFAPKWSLSPGGHANPMMYVVERGEFIHDVTERGSLESASNFEITSKVKNPKSSSGNMILEIVPEGTYIRPEDVDRKVLVRLDSSALEEQRSQQQIICENSKAAVIQAQNVMDTAKIAKREYLEGTHLEELLDLDIKISEARVELRQAKEYLIFSERLERKGYVTKLQLEDDRTAVEKAENVLKLALKKREVLEEFKKDKMAKQLVADIKTAEAKYAAEKISHELDMERLEFIDEQITNCTIVAPEPGQVVYANVQSRRGSGEVVIEEGTMIRENQVIIRLPDPRRMQVKTRIDESRISMVRAGMTATIRLDAFPDIVLNGVVEEVGEYPAPTSWYRSDVKEYETIVAIKNPPADLRPGLTAEVRTRVQHLGNVAQVPVQAVIQHGDKYYCVVRDGKRGFRPHEVTIGPTNDKFVVIEKGLGAGDRIVHNSAAYREEIDLPDLPPEENGKPAAGKPGAGKPGAGKPGAGKPGAGPGKKQGPAGKRPNPGQMFGRLDANGNGKIEQEELGRLPEQARSAIGSADANGDGVIDRAEFGAAASKFGRGHGAKPPHPGGRP